MGKVFRGTVGHDLHFTWRRMKSIKSFCGGGGPAAPVFSSDVQPLASLLYLNFTFIESSPNIRLSHWFFISLFFIQQISDRRGECFHNDRFHDNFLDTDVHGIFGCVNFTETNAKNDRDVRSNFQEFFRQLRA